MTRSIRIALGLFVAILAAAPVLALTLEPADCGMPCCAPAPDRVAPADCGSTLAAMSCCDVAPDTVPPVTERVPQPPPHQHAPLARPVAIMAPARVRPPMGTGSTEASASARRHSVVLLI